MRKPFDLLDEAYEKFNPVHVTVLFSGGNDSIVTAHIAKRWAEKRGIDIAIDAIDTTLHIDVWPFWVRYAAASSGFENLTITKTPEDGWYEDWVIKYGFPYTKKMHKQTYQRLKERVIEKILRERKGDERTNKVLFITGIRRYESPERYDYDPINNPKGSQAFVNPIIDYRDEYRDKYQRVFSLPVNPYNVLGLGSGDCQCNWGAFVNIVTLKRHSPKLAARIEPLHHEARKIHGWGFGEVPSKSLKTAMKGQEIMPGLGVFLCAGCERIEEARKASA